MILEDNISIGIQEVFKSEIQLKRLNKEFQMLKDLKKDEFKLTLIQCSSGLNIIVEVTLQFLQYKKIYLNQKRPILFILKLENKFPFTFPRVYCLSCVTENPSLSDGRDYLQNIINRIWTPSVLLYEIVLSLPKFLAEIQERSQEQPYLLNLGQYHLDQEYDMEDIQQLEQTQLFQCREIQAGNQGTNKQNIRISKGYMVFYDKFENSTVLSQSIQLRNLMNIRRRQVNENVIVFNWKDQNMKDGRLQIFYVNKCDECITHIVNNMKQYGVKVMRQQTSQGKIQERDVTLQQFSGVDQFTLLSHISKCERNLDQNVNNNNVKQLMEAYQQAIEYYSAHELENYKEFVVKLKELIGRQDVQNVIAARM